MRIRMIVALGVVLALAACGVGGDPKPKSSNGSAKDAAMDAALPNVADGRAVPEALSDFVCSRDDEGTWQAAGVVSNATKTPTTFQVTVHVGPADGQGAAARTKRIDSVQPKGSVGFDLGEIESRSPDGPCHVQVLALSGPRSG